MSDAVTPQRVPGRVPGRSGSGRVSRTLGALALLLAALPFSAALTAVAALRAAVRPSPARATPRRPRTVLLTGGKMTKALHLARAFHRAGHRVVLVETARYRLTAHRFSRAVDAFHVVPDSADPRYPQALLAIVEREGVDVFVPVCSPASSVHDAAAAPLLATRCEVLHAGLEVVELLDDKHRFAELSAELGLPVPRSHRITAPEQVLDLGLDGPHVLKSIPYDPVNRLDLTPLPRPTPEATLEFLRGKDVRDGHPWVLQEFVAGKEYCTHSTVRNGRVVVYGCCESSAFQVNYEMVDKPEIERWVRAFAEATGVTGQVSFDFIESADGRALAIECNPRTHSAITMFHDHPDLARAYLDPDAPQIRPLPSSRPTYWLFHELWRALSEPGTARERLRVVARGKEAVFDWSDPLPFLLLHHVHVPLLLLRALVRGQDWVRVDFNIGKLVAPSGD
ncbi:ATP-grasp enzyme [Actinosynnema pretiosum subsp. pretiosum]|uniref:ATP-grasp enzyme n=1 Tax=Actinosynnema pretiosum subsp. pretiosum TaxID=103721 RepID=A0AA45R481_9PSEU|nr:ATP-grasp enzyme [Actinosynnema pretiosum subsp. pretiosum]